MNNTIRAHSVFTSDELLPLYEVNALGEVLSASVKLDLRTGEIDAMTDSTPGSCSMDEFHGLILSFNIGPNFTCDEIEDLIEGFRRQAQSILDTTTIAYDNGREIVVSEVDLEDIYGREYDKFYSKNIVMSASDIEDDFNELIAGIEESTDLEILAREIFDTIDDNDGVYLAPSLNCVDEIKSLLEDIYEENKG